MHKNTDQLTSISEHVPYTYFGFTIHLALNGICLKWVTGAEENIERFDILHSRDGIHFSKLTCLAARGNSNFPSNYEWIHTAPAKGSNYYRLQQFDKEGQFFYSAIIYLL